MGEGGCRGDDPPFLPPSLKNDTKQKYIVEKSDHKNVITKYIAVLIIQSIVKTVHSIQQPCSKGPKTVQLKLFQSKNMTKNTITTV